MDVNVTAVKGPSHKTGIKANLFYFSCIALFFFRMNWVLGDPMAA